jgi:dihydroxyacetone kinase-like protein
VLLLVNGFGATPLIELYLMANSAGRIGRCRAQSDVFPDRVLRNITRHGRRIDDGIVLDDQAKKLWDAPVHTAAMRWGA